MITKNLNPKKTSKATVKTKIVKAFSYGIWSFAITFILAYGITTDEYLAAIIAGIEICIKPFIYFIHEYLWLPNERRSLDEDTRNATGIRFRL